MAKLIIDDVLIGEIDDAVADRLKSLQRKLGNGRPHKELPFQAHMDAMRASIPQITVETIRIEFPQGGSKSS